MTETETTASPAQELRAAASKISDTASAALAGPWYPNTDDVMTDWDPNSSDFERYNEDLYVGHSTGGNSAHIALWHPGVAEVVAEWLDTEAHAVESSLAAFPDIDAEKLVRWPLRIARAINGEVAA